MARHIRRRSPPASLPHSRSRLPVWWRFFLKALFAAIPAIILLGIMLWVMGQVLTTYFPALLKMKILITFPN